MTSFFLLELPLSRHSTRSSAQTRQQDGPTSTNGNSSNPRKRGLRANTGTGTQKSPEPDTDYEGVKTRSKTRSKGKKEKVRDPGSPRFQFRPDEVPERTNQSQAKVDAGRALRQANNALHTARTQGIS